MVTIWAFVLAYAKSRYSHKVHLQISKDHKSNDLGFASREDSAKPGHPHSLISPN